MITTPVSLTFSPSRLDRSLRAPIEHDLYGRWHGLRDQNADEEALPAFHRRPVACPRGKREELARQTDLETDCARRVGRRGRRRDARGHQVSFRLEEQFLSVVAPPHCVPSLRRDPHAPPRFGKRRD